MKRVERRVPRAQVEEAADALAAWLGVDPEQVPCDFARGAVEVRAEDLVRLLAAARSTMCGKADHHTEEAPC